MVKPAGGSPPRFGWWPALFGLAVFASAGCGTASLVSQWNDETYSGKPFERILVIGFTPNDANRRAFETEFVKQLDVRVQVAGFASHELLPDFENLDSLRVVEVVKEGGYDAVLVTRLVSVDREMQFTSGDRKVVPETYYNDFYDYYYTVYREVRSPSSVGEAETVVLETNVYETSGARLVWTGRTESYSPESIPQVVDDLAILVLTSLQKFKLI